MLNQNKTEKSNYLSRVGSFNWWLKKQFSGFLMLLKMIYFRFPFQLIRAEAVWLLVYGLIFPFCRILLGGEEAYRICGFFINKYYLQKEHFRSLIIPLHPLSKNRMMFRDAVDFGAYREICVYNIYFHEALRNGMNIIDIGAHIGVYTVLVAEKVGETGKIIAIEPEPRNYEQLLKNIKINNFRNIIPLNIALFNHEGYEKLFLSSFSSSHSLSPKKDTISSIEVPVKTLDNLLKELNFNTVDIIKIDTEGAEIPILKGAEKTLKANPNAKIIVASYHYPSEKEEVCQFLNERGFKTKVLLGDIVVTI